MLKLKQAIPVNGESNLIIGWITSEEILEKIDQKAKKQTRLWKNTGQNQYIYRHSEVEYQIWDYQQPKEDEEFGTLVTGYIDLDDYSLEEIEILLKHFGHSSLKEFEKDSNEKGIEDTNQLLVTLLVTTSVRKQVNFTPFEI